MNAINKKEITDKLEEIVSRIASSTDSGEISGLVDKHKVFIHDLFRLHLISLDMIVSLHDTISILNDKISMGTMDLKWIEMLLRNALQKNRKTTNIYEVAAKKIENTIFSK